MLLSAAISAVVTQGGFDTTSSSSADATIRGWINECVQDALGRSKWRKAKVSLGVTVAGQSEYLLPASVVDLKTLRVGASRPWLRVGTEDLWGLQAGDVLRGAPGAFAPSFEADADATVALYPAPAAAGLAIEALAAVLATDIDAGTSTALELGTLVPADLAPRICVDGPVGLGLQRVHERADLAGPFTGRFEAAIQELSRRANTRIGSGATFARLVRP